MKSSSPTRKVASNLLLLRGEFVANPVVEVDGEGRILSVEVGVESIDRSPQTEFYGGIMLPGFVNAHCHLELSYLRGAIEPGGGFATFGESIGAVRGRYSDEERLNAMVRADIEMVREGVVGVGDIVNGDTSFATKLSSGVEYRNFAEVFGLSSVDTSAVDGLLSNSATTLTPHSLYSLNDQAFKKSVNDGSPLSIHFMESPSEMELYQGRGALYDWYSRVGFKCDFLHYGSPAERLISSVPADRSVMLVHNCCVTQRDIDLIMGHFTAPVYWVLCPRSNRYISGITPPYELLRSNGLNICIGTDSLASNWSLSMLSELREVKSTPLAERLTWATHNGAKALLLNDLGDIEAEKSPGINILSAIDYDSMELTPESRIRRIV